MCDQFRSQHSSEIVNLQSSVSEIEEKLEFTVTDDGNGNVIFGTMPFMSVEDDGSGNVVIY